MQLKSMAISSCTTVYIVSKSNTGRIAALFYFGTEHLGQNVYAKIGCKSFPQYSVVLLFSDQSALIM